MTPPKPNLNKPATRAKSPKLGRRRISSDASTSKNSPKSNSDTDINIDRISALHDCLLHHILSFLETKYSVGTSVLSKRWINVWKFVPHLDLVEQNFNQIENFVNFGNSIFDHKLSPDSPEKLDTFNLTWCSEEMDYEAIETWICNLASLKPRVVNIELEMLYEWVCPSCLFEDCPSIETMRLDLIPCDYACWTKIDPIDVNLPCLMSLKLCNIDLNDEFIENLMLGCPAIEKLHLSDCILDFTAKINSSSVKTLIISGVQGERGNLQISTPGLVNLECEGANIGYISFENLKCLEHARVCIYGSSGEKYNREEVELLKGLTNAKTIRLTGFEFQGFIDPPAAYLPVFEKLERLSIGEFEIDEMLEPLASLLKHTPNLNNLTLRHLEVVKLVAGVDTIPLEKLKTVEIECCKNKEQGAHLMANYLIKHLDNINFIQINPHTISCCIWCNGEHSNLSRKGLWF